MAAKPGARVRRKAAPSAVAVSADERWHLIEDCAFFHADRFRSAAPGSVRESDQRTAAAEIDGIIGATRRRRQK